MKPGTFITFEGIDGCGKTTQIQLARTFLEKQGNQVITTLEPGGTDIGIQIRKILLNQKNQSLVQESEMLLYLADRIQHLKEVILPALEKGNLVLCDRFHDSTLAYQGFGRGLDLKLIRSIEEKAITPHTPFLTFLLDIEPKLALKRTEEKYAQRNQQDRLEQESIDFFERITWGYQQLAEASPDRFVCLDGSKSKEHIHQQIIKTLETRLSERKSF